MDEAWPPSFREWAMASTASKSGGSGFLSPHSSVDWPLSLGFMYLDLVLAEVPKVPRLGIS